MRTSGALLLKSSAKHAIRRVLPLSFRKQLAIWISDQKWIRPDRRAWWSIQILQDLTEIDINEYHKFLWSNHLAYAGSYEVPMRFGSEKMKQSRQIFFQDLKKHLIGLGIDPKSGVQSVFEVGCSSGYQLRYLETDIFTEAKELEGLDIDRHAVENGSNYLRRIGSKAQLKCGDIENLDRAIGSKIYDVMICTGVLMYLREDSAARVVDAMMRHSGRMVAIAGLAYPDFDNALLEHSVVRDDDRSFIHNIDAMATWAGGTVVGRSWEGARLVDGHTIYFVFVKKHAHGNEDGVIQVE